MSMEDKIIEQAMEAVNDKIPPPRGARCRAWGESEVDAIIDYSTHWCFKQLAELQSGFSEFLSPDEKAEIVKAVSGILGFRSLRADRMPLTRK